MTATEDVVLRVSDVRKSYGDIEALRGVDLDVRAGEVVGLLGPNGAGKTTLVRVVATLIPPDAGSITVCGHDVDAAPGQVRAHLGLAGQFASVDELLTGRENLELVGRLYGLGAGDTRERARQLLDGLGLDGHADRRVSTYSGGLRRRLDLGATLMGQPALLLLDEPTTGLDPRSRLRIWALIRQIAGFGTAVLVTSQNLDEVEHLADRVVVVDRGTVIADDRPHVLRGRMGGHVVQVRFADDGLSGASDAGPRAATAIFGPGAVSPDATGSGQLTATAPGTFPDTMRALTQLAETGTEVVEVVYRPRTLEETFLALTDGHRDEDPGRLGDDDGPPDDRELPPPTELATTRSALRDAAVVIARDAKRMIRTPESVFFALIMPIMFVLGLRAVFGDLVATVVGVDYIQFLLPGTIVMQLALSAGATGVGLATDLRDGIVDRFRSLPMAPAAVLAGRTTTDLGRNALVVAVTVVTGMVMGFRFDGGPAGAVAGIAVALVFGYALNWVFAAVGLAVRDPQAANFVGFAPVLLFVYLSSAWVPIETMNGGVQAFARNQPVNVTIDAVRALVNGDPAGAATGRSLAWSVALIAVFGTIASRRFRSSTA